ncbi:MAG TPA: phosphatidate cytidylyltransferase [Pirellulales bacterium]|nr:phosphatidate cytidylyltransferase [Pirellulales bacterium]
MNAATHARLFGYEQAFANPATKWIAIVLAMLLGVTPIVFLALQAMGRLRSEQRRELWLRYVSWLALVPLMLVPVLLGAAWTIGAVALLSLLCYREFSRAPGMPRDRSIEAVVYLGIALVTLASADHWYGFFVALFPLTVCAIAAVAILADRPQGYIQRCALGALGFMLFGGGLGHLGYLANEANYRPIVLLTLLAVELNDVFAYCSGKTFGRGKLAPHTSPNKTLGGALGAVVLTTVLVVWIGRYAFASTPLAATGHLIVLGAMISIVGQLGDLMLSSVKRDLGIKDMGEAIPGHGGLLDRFDSLILVAPAVFHYVNYFAGIGLDQMPRWFLG